MRETGQRETGQQEELQRRLPQLLEEELRRTPTGETPGLLERVHHQGRRARRVRAARRGCVGLLTVVAAAGVAVSVPGLAPADDVPSTAVGPAGPLPTQPPAGAPTGSTPAAPAATTATALPPEMVPTGTAPVQLQRAVAAVLAPARYEVLQSVGYRSGSYVDGNLDDDGGAPSRVFVSVSQGAPGAPGPFPLHPCADPKFAQGGTCQEQELPHGGTRTVVDHVDEHGIRSTRVQLAGTDGSGAVAIAETRAATPDPGESGLTPVRPAPALDAAALADLAAAAWGSS